MSVDPDVTNGGTKPAGISRRELLCVATVLGTLAGYLFESMRIEQRTADLRAKIGEPFQIRCQCWRLGEKGDGFEYRIQEYDDSPLIRFTFVTHDILPEGPIMCSGVFAEDKGSFFLEDLKVTETPDGGHVQYLNP